ncbi:hypothetical protein T08_12436 [Trichinella sp. T8]|nr:hypothetical protein T08_12436 [Trichinella sp. T8]
MAVFERNPIFDDEAESESSSSDDVDDAASDYLDQEERLIASDDSSSDDSSEDEPPDAKRTKAAADQDRKFTCKSGRVWTTSVPSATQTRSHNIVRQMCAVFTTASGIQCPGDAIKLLITPAMMFWDSGMFPHAVLVHNRMFIRAGGISLISEPAQFRVTTATLSAVSSNNGWQMPKLFKGADAAFDVWRLLLSIVVQTKGTMLTSGFSAGVLFNKGGADLLSAAVALLMVDLVTILLFSRASLFDIDLSLLLRTAVWDTDEFLDVPGFLRVFAHLITEPREQLSKRANHARERSRVGNFRVVPPPQVKSGLPVIPCISRRLFLCRTR